jgi:hypothetical protein
MPSAWRPIGATALLFGVFVSLLTMRPTPATAAPVAPLARPDLRIAYTGDTTVSAGRDFKYVMRVTNAGAPTAINQRIEVLGSFLPGFRIVSLSGSDGAACRFDNEAYYSKDERYAVWVCTFDRAMLTGGSTTVSATVRAPATALTYFMIGIVDPSNSVTEANEANNDVSPTIQVQ